jgi:hypothetical protein
MTARIRGAIRMLYPDHITPTARNVLERILDDDNHHEAPDTSGAFECTEET